MKLAMIVSASLVALASCAPAQSDSPPVRRYGNPINIADGSTGQLTVSAAVAISDGVNWGTFTDAGQLNVNASGITVSLGDAGISVSASPNVNIVDGGPITTQLASGIGVYLLDGGGQTFTCNAGT